MLFDINKSYKTDCGFPTRFYAVMHDQNEIHGACKVGSEWMMMKWELDTGKSLVSNDYNLRESKDLGYINLYVDCIGIVSTDGAVYDTSEEADGKALPNRVGRVRIEYTFGTYEE